MKVTLARLNGRVTRPECGTILELREQLRRALDQLVELIGKLRRVAYNKTDIVHLRISVTLLSPSLDNLRSERVSVTVLRQPRWVRSSIKRLATWNTVQNCDSGLVESN